MEKNQENFDIMQYPEGFERTKKELLNFLPDDPQAREAFMRFVLQWFIQW